MTTKDQMETNQVNTATETKVATSSKSRVAALESILIILNKLYTTTLMAVVLAFCVYSTLTINSQASEIRAQAASIQMMQTALLSQVEESKRQSLISTKKLEGAMADIQVLRSQGAAQNASLERINTSVGKTEKKLTVVARDLHKVLVVLAAPPWYERLAFWR